jgi:hypothetical protein
MADKGRLSVEQRIKTVLFFTETRSFVATERWFCAQFQMQFHSKQFINFTTSLIMMAECWERKCHQPSTVHSLENTVAVRVMLQRSPSKSTRKAAAQLTISR